MDKELIQMRIQQREMKKKNYRGNNTRDNNNNPLIVGKDTLNKNRYSVDLKKRFLRSFSKYPYTSKNRK